MLHRPPVKENPPRTGHAAVVRRRSCAEEACNTRKTEHEAKSVFWVSAFYDGPDSGADRTIDLMSFLL